MYYRAVYKFQYQIWHVAILTFRRLCLAFSASRLVSNGPRITLNQSPLLPVLLRISASKP